MNEALQIAAQIGCLASDREASFRRSSTNGRRTDIPFPLFFLDFLFYLSYPNYPNFQDEIPWMTEGFLGGVYDDVSAGKTNGRMEA